MMVNATTLGYPTTFRYHSALNNWHSTSNVRTKPRRVLNAMSEEDFFYFPPDLVPVSQHPTVLSLGEDASRNLVTNHLYRYLDFTVTLENGYVNPAAMGIARGDHEIAFPIEMRDDAFKLYCDEAYHALYSLDLKRQVERRSGISCQEVSEPVFVRELEAIQHALPERHRQMAVLFFVIVSETLLSKTLKSVPADERVDPAVRSVIRDHAEDERLHHGFFSSVLRFVWPRLSKQQQSTMGRIVPCLIYSFLKPDIRAIVDDLQALRLDRETAVSIVADCYKPAVIADSIRDEASATVNHFRKCGAFEIEEVRGAFADYGLLDQ